MGCHALFPGDLPDPGMKPRLVLPADSTVWATREVPAKTKGSSQIQEENPPFFSGVPVAPSTDKTYHIQCKEEKLGVQSIMAVHFSRSVESYCLNCSTPGFPVHHQLPELAQTHVHRVGDAIQPSNPLSSPSPPAFNLSQHQGLFQWVSSSHQSLAE